MHPDDEEFKEFIKIISLYLTFIEKKPLHPPGNCFWRRLHNLSKRKFLLLHWKKIIHKRG